MVLYFNFNYFKDASSDNVSKLFQTILLYITKCTCYMQVIAIVTVAYNIKTH